MYNRVTPRIVDDLRAIVGEGNVRTDEEALEKYAHPSASGPSRRSSSSSTPRRRSPRSSAWPCGNASPSPRAGPGTA